MDARGVWDLDVETLTLAHASHLDQFLSLYQAVRAEEVDSVGMPRCISWPYDGRLELSLGRSAGFIPQPEVPGGLESTLTVPGGANVYISLFVNSAVEPRFALSK